MTLGLLLFALAADPLPATRVTIEDHPRSLQQNLDLLRKQGGPAVDATKVEATKVLTTPRTPSTAFWTALETLATASGSHIDLADQGRNVRLMPGAPATPSSVDGPFRIVATNVVCRLDLVSGRRVCEVTLEVHWEPRMAVFRIDSPPSITKAVDDRGGVLKAMGTPSKSAIGGTAMHTLVVQFENVPRDVKSIATLEGHFTVTAAAKLLNFAFTDVSKLPATLTQDDVSVTLQSLKGRDAKIELNYPADHPEFESFESWTDFNTIKLISADRTKSWEPNGSSVQGRGRVVVCEYRFKDVPTAASAVYTTPSPLREYPVKFSLKDISLP